MIYVEAKHPSQRTKVNNEHKRKNYEHEKENYEDELTAELLILAEVLTDKKTSPPPPWSNFS